MATWSLLQEVQLQPARRFGLKQDNSLPGMPDIFNHDVIDVLWL